MISPVLVFILLSCVSDSVSLGDTSLDKDLDEVLGGALALLDQGLLGCVDSKQTTVDHILTRREVALTEALDRIFRAVAVLEANVLKNWVPKGMLSCPPISKNGINVTDLSETTRGHLRVDVVTAVGNVVQPPQEADRGNCSALSDEGLLFGECAKEYLALFLLHLMTIVIALCIFLLMIVCGYQWVVRNARFEMV